MSRDPNARGAHEVADLAPLMLRYLIAANAAARAKRLASSANQDRRIWTRQGRKSKTPTT